MDSSSVPLFLTKAIVKCPGAIPKSFNTSITPAIPLLKFKIAEHTPTSNVLPSEQILLLGIFAR